MDVKHKVRTYFGKVLHESKVSDDDSLLVSGIIDSLKMLDLITYLEKEFAVTIDEDELLPDNFDSVNAIVNFIEEKRS